MSTLSRPELCNVLITAAGVMHYCDAPQGSHRNHRSGPDGPIWPNEEYREPSPPGTLKTLAKETRRSLVDTARERRESDARARAAEGIAHAVEGAGEQWMDDAWRFLVRYSESHEEVFCDDLWAAGMPRHPEGKTKALGALMQRGRRAGILEATGEFRPSASSNMSAKPVWRSLCCEKS